MNARLWLFVAAVCWVPWALIFVAYVVCVAVISNWLDMSGEWSFLDEMAIALLVRIPFWSSVAVAFVALLQLLMPNKTDRASS